MLSSFHTLYQMKPVNTRILLVVLVAVAILFALSLAKPTEGFGGADSLTMYYADWCPHCKTIKPVFREYSKSGVVTINEKQVFLSMVEVEQEPEKAKGKPVRGFPTFLLERANGEFKEFDGDRSPEGWTSWLKANL